MFKAAAITGIASAVSFVLLRVPPIGPVGACATYAQCITGWIGGLALIATPFLVLIGVIGRLIKRAKAKM
jgi:hypothetical protein